MCSKVKVLFGNRLAFALAAVGVSASAFAMTPGGVRKKFVALNFDTFFNAPSNVCAHAEKLNAVPWLDGVTVALRDVPVKTLDGEAATSESTRIMHLGHRWSREGVKDQIPYLQGIVKYPRLKESFLLGWITPSGKENRIAWTDDAGWKLFTENLAVLAWLAKTSGLKGLMLDPEEYSAALQYLYTSAEKDISFVECARLARQRGREVFSRVFAEFPDGVYFFLWTLEHHVRCFADRDATDPRRVSDADGELLPYFYNGMLDVMPPTVRFVDGAEHYSLTATKDMYWKGALNQLVGARPFVAPENWAKYRGQLLVGNTHYLDMFSQEANPRSHWYHGPVNGTRLEHLRVNLAQSVQVADEYVWIYGESGRLIDWDCAVTKSQTDRRKLWTDQIPGLTETMMMAKDPDALLEMRKAEYAARGELRNLAEGCAGLPAKFAYSDERKPYVSKVTRSVKGVRAKEVYQIIQEVRFNMSEEHPELAVSWRAKGKDLAAKAASPLVFEPGKPKNSSWLRGYVTVPEGADEMVLSFEAALKPGENAWAGKTEVFKVCETPGGLGEAPVRAYKPTGAKKGGKWTFDEKTRRLSDGNWDLGAWYADGDKTKTLLSVNGAKASGSGGLDFTDVEKDTGKKVVAVNSFTRNLDVTELIGPDVRSLGMDAMRFCGNLRRVALSPDLAQLTTSCFAYCTNLVSFSPTTLPAGVRLAGNSQFQSCSALEADFVYEGTAPLASSMFASSGIRSLRAPKCDDLGRNVLSGCRNLRYLSFAEEKAFADEKERLTFFRESRAKAGALPNLIAKDAKPFESLKAGRSLHACLEPLPSAKVRPGELYGVGISCRMTAFGGSNHFRVKWLKDGKPLTWDTERPFSMKGPRENGVWCSGSVLVRVPAEADELVLDVGATVEPGESFEFDKVEIFKLGEPLPVWPADCEHEKGFKK